MNNIKLNAWFEMDEGEYIWYLMQGYEIEIGDVLVLFTKDGKHHRTDGPAYIGSDGTQAWYLDGNLHRTDGPAIIWAGGTQSWYLDGVKYSKQAFEKIINEQYQT